MVEGNEYLEYLNESLECEAKLWRPLALFTEIEMAAFELTVWTAVRGYHVYKDIWTPTIGEEFVCRQEWGNDHDRHAVAVHGDGEDVFGHCTWCSAVTVHVIWHQQDVTSYS